MGTPKTLFHLPDCLCVCSYSALQPFFWCCLFFKNIKNVKPFYLPLIFAFFPLLPVCSHCLAGLLPVTPALCMLAYGV